MELCFKQVLRLKQSTVNRQMALLWMGPARQLLHAPAGHLTPMTWHTLKTQTLRRLPERVRTCLIMSLRGTDSGLVTAARQSKSLPKDHDMIALPRG